MSRYVSRISAISLACAQTCALLSGSGCIVLGHDESKGFLTAAPGFSISYPTATRDTYVTDETAVRTVTFSHTGDRAICSRDAGRTFANCDTTNTFIWRAGDYQTEHVIKVGRPEAEPYVHHFVPSQVMPGLTFVDCDEEISTNENFTAFQLHFQAANAGVPGHPHVICVKSGVTVGKSTGEPEVTVGGSSFLLIAREGDVATVENADTPTGSVAGEGILDVAGNTDFSIVGLKMHTVGSHGHVVDNAGAGFILKDSQVTMDGIADNGFGIVALADATVADSTISQCGACSGANLTTVSGTVKNSNFQVGVGGFGILLNGSGGNVSIDGLVMNGLSYTGIEVNASNTTLAITGLRETTTIAPILDLSGTSNTVTLTGSSLVSGSDGSVGIEVGISNQVKISGTDLTVSGSAPAVHVGATSTFKLSDSSLNATSGEALSVAGGIIGVTIETSTLISTGFYGIAANPGAPITVLGSTIKSGFSAGINMTGTGPLTVTDSHFVSTSGKGLILQGGDTAVVTGSSFTTDDVGIHLMSTGKVVITNTSIQTASADGVMLDTAGTLTLSGGKIDATNGYGVHLGGDGHGDVSGTVITVHGSGGSAPAGMSGDAAQLHIHEATLNDGIGNGGFNISGNGNLILDNNTIRRLDEGLNGLTGAVIAVQSGSPLIDTTLNGNLYCDVNKSSRGFSALSSGPIFNIASSFDFNNQVTTTNINDCP